MENKAVKHLLRAFKASKVYTPRFIPGDLILNKYMDNVYLVKVVGMRRDEDDLNCDNAWYKLVTLYHSNSSVKRLYEREKLVRSIDAYYEKIDSNVAQVLYGVNVKGVEDAIKSKYNRS